LNQEQAYKKIEAHWRANNEHFIKRFTRYFKSKERGEDVVSECYTKALTYWSTAPEEDDHFEKWLRTILNNCGKTNHKEEAQHGATNHVEVDEELVDTGANEVVIPAIILQKVTDLIKTKDAAEQMVLKLALLEGWKGAQIVDVVDYKLSTIRNIVFKFRQEIRDRWKVAV
jgi:RNA polymerase sigma factor (sigma-70 family)